MKKLVKPLIYRFLEKNNRIGGEMGLMMMEELFGKARKVANAAGKKTGELVEISKLKLSAMQVNTDIKALYEKLGSAVYSMNKAHYENSELLESLTEEIDEKRAELKKINDKIATLQKAKECPCCQTKNPQTAFYCQKCGSKLPISADSSDDDDNDDGCCDGSCACDCGCDCHAEEMDSEE